MRTAWKDRLWRRRYFVGALIVLLSLPQGCARGQAPEAASEQVLQEDREEAALSRTTATPRLLFVGAGLWDQDTFERDMTVLCRVLRGKAPERGACALLSNYRPGLEEPLPSSHGAPGAIAAKLPGEGETRSFPAGNLRDSLAPLQGHRVLLILSACYSGSLIPDLSDDGWAIMTAARADRASFGCQPGSRHSYFIESLLQALREDNRSLTALYTRTRALVAAREKRLGDVEPSLPQLFVGKLWPGGADAALF
jgi:hypothetical protein